MNARIYVKKPNGKNQGLRLKLGGGFAMSELTKRVQDTRYT